MSTDLKDPRWGDYVPWFLRHKDFNAAGQFSTFFSLVSQRLSRLFMFNEPGIPNLPHFGSWLESESLQRFRFTSATEVSGQISYYFNPKRLDEEAKERAQNDPEEKNVENVRVKWDAARLAVARNPSAEANQTVSSLYVLFGESEKASRDTREERIAAHYNQLVIERLEVLQCLLGLLPKNNSFTQLLIRDLRRFFAESGVMLDIIVTDQVPIIRPMEEPLLQKAVLEELMPRLSSHYPDRAREFIDAYHNLLEGEEGDKVFSDAFKTLEAFARDLTGDTGFMFDRRHLDKNFGNLHATIHETLIKVAGHRGDKASHGRDAPPPHEMRYLLFAICNAALLLLDYPSK